MAPNNFTHAKGCPLWHGTGNYCNCPSRPNAANEAAGPASGASTPRTPEERERMYALLYEAQVGNLKWTDYGVVCRKEWMRDFDRLLTAFPQLWDSLPPDPAEQARKEAEEDGRLLERWRGSSVARDFVALADRMTARAAAGYPALIAPKEEK